MDLEIKVKPTGGEMITDELILIDLPLYGHGGCRS